MYELQMARVDALDAADGTLDDIQWQSVFSGRTERSHVCEGLEAVRCLPPLRLGVLLPMAAAPGSAPPSAAPRSRPSQDTEYLFRVGCANSTGHSPWSEQLQVAQHAASSRSPSPPALHPSPHPQVLTRP